jgi:hypothetical protein
MVYCFKISQIFIVFYEGVHYPLSTYRSITFSIAQKIALIKKGSLFGFSGWALGLELASVYTAMKEEKNIDLNQKRHQYV